MNGSARASVFVVFLATSVLADVDPSRVAAEIEAISIDATQPRDATSLRLNIGVGNLRFDKGRLYPTSPVAGNVVEFVFIGSGRIEYEPSEEMERRQLELFTGSSALSEEFTEAVFVFGNEDAAKGLLARRRADADAESGRRAESLLGRWKKSPERRIAGVDSALLADAVGDAIYKSLFVGFIHAEEAGDFVFAIDPAADEQLTIGEFVPIETTERQKRKLLKQLHREQRRGRLLGKDIHDFGSWNTWVSLSLQPAGERPAPRIGFTATKHTIDLSIADPSLRLSASSKTEIRAVTGRRRVATFVLPTDLVVKKVSIGSGAPLFHLRSGAEVAVVLPDAPAAGETRVLTIEYEGEIFERDGRRAIYLRYTALWHPIVSRADSPSYDVTFRWPRRLSLLSSGRTVGSGESGDIRWERRVLDGRVRHFGFELGRYRIDSMKAGRVNVTLAYDPTANTLPVSIREEIRKTVADALKYFEETYGPYPLDELVVVTAPHDSSYAFGGFISLSNEMMTAFDIYRLSYGYQDRRTVIAHEIAHQWFGMMLSTADYRDQWLREALSSYAAMQFARAKIPNAQRISGPIANWQSVLRDQTDGRSLESLGPLVLGTRLDSSRADAYAPIVYLKGPIVIDMLARSLRHETFDRLLREMVASFVDRPVSTESFLRFVERAESLIPIGNFARQFIYGTGIPLIEYDYEFNRATDAGKWEVKGTARQYMPARYKYRIVKRDDGEFAVAREPVLDANAAGWSLIAPMHIGIMREAPGKLAQHERDYGNGLIHGSIRIHGETSEFGGVIDHEPRTIWIDAFHEALALFYNRKHNPRVNDLLRAGSAAFRGDAAQAEAYYRKAVTAEKSRSLEAEFVHLPQEVRAEYAADWNAWLIAHAHIGLANLYLDAGRLADVAPAIVEARKSIGLNRRSWIESDLGVIEATLDLRRGDAERAYKRFRKLLLGRSASVDDPEAYAHFAIAAKKTVTGNDLRKAIDAAKRKGVDVAALE